jgi:hypothetical protein
MTSPKIIEDEFSSSHECNKALQWRLRASRMIMRKVGFERGPEVLTVES